MADHKPEMLISKSVCNITAQFQQLYPCFQGPEIQRNYSLLCVMQAKAEIQDGDSLRRNTYVCESTSWIPDLSCITHNQK